MNPLRFVEVILAFGFMISIHEWGHFIVCRLFKVEVDEFAIGFGNVLFSRKWRGTLYTLRAFPLGGFCKPKGGDLSGQSAEEMYAKAPEPGDFLYASWWKRIVIFLAGPAMNFISGILILYLVLVAGEKISNEKSILGFVPPQSLAYDCGFKENDHLIKADGKPVSNLSTDLDAVYEKFAKSPLATAVITVERAGKTLDLTLKGDPQKEKLGVGFLEAMPPVIGDVPLGTPAWKAGVRPGDRVVSVNGKKVSEWTELTYDIKSTDNDLVQLVVSRNGKEYPVAVRRIYNGMDRVIGISPQEDSNFIIKRWGPVEAFPEAFGRATSFCVFYLDVIGKLVTGKMSFVDNVGGAVTIIRTMYQKASEGLEQFARTVASISLILCLMNLLPLGIVDGGQILLTLVEGLKRQPLSVKFQQAYQVAGFALVVCLMGFAIFMDVWGWVMEKLHSQIP